MELGHFLAMGSGFAYTVPNAVWGCALCILPPPPSPPPDPRSHAQAEHTPIAARLRGGEHGSKICPEISSRKICLETIPGSRWMGK